MTLADGELYKMIVENADVHGSTTTLLAAWLVIVASRAQPQPAASFGWVLKLGSWLCHSLLE